MSLFHRRPDPILQRSDYTVVLAAELDPQRPERLGRLLFTGHDGDRGVIRALVPGGEVLWEARFASEHDVNEGLLAVTHGLVISHDPGGKALMARDQWTGKERWRTPIGKLVDRLGLDPGKQEVVAVTFDHVVHGLSIATGAARQRGTVATDEERQAVLAGTALPWPSDWPEGDSSRPSVPHWSRAYAPFPELRVLRRDWAGTHAWGLSDAEGNHVRELGRGRYRGGQQAGPLRVLRFELSPKAEGQDDGDGETHHHHLLLGEGLALLGALREGRESEFYEGGKPFWKGAL